MIGVVNGLCLPSDRRFPQQTFQIKPAGVHRQFPIRRVRPLLPRMLLTRGSIRSYDALLIYVLLLPTLWNPRRPEGWPLLQ